jgi:hypothetical protein
MTGLDFNASTLVHISSPYPLGKYPGLQSSRIGVPTKDYVTQTEHLATVSLAVLAFPVLGYVGYSLKVHGIVAEN